MHRSSAHGREWNVEGQIAGGPGRRLGCAAVAAFLATAGLACNRSATARQDQSPAAGNRSDASAASAAGPSQAGGGAQPSRPNAPIGDNAATPAQAEQAMSHVVAAIQAIRQKEDQRAGQLLETVAGTLRTMYESVPGRSVVSQMDRAVVPGSEGAKGGEAKAQTKQAPDTATAEQGGGDAAGSNRVQLAPLVAEVSAQSIYLDPKVVAGVKQAEKQSGAGDQQAATRSLRLAREQMVADIALLPVEEAYSRVVAARLELQAGRRENALQLLQNVPVVVTQVRSSAPLVPARFNLRAGAAAAAGNWQRAEELVGQAQKTLDAAASSPAMGDELKPLADRAGQLHGQLSAGKKPKAKQIRALAEDIRKRVRSM